MKLLLSLLHLVTASPLVPGFGSAGGRHLQECAACPGLADYIQELTGLSSETDADVRSTKTFELYCKHREALVCADQSAECRVTGDTSDDMPSLLACFCDACLSVPQAFPMLKNGDMDVEQRCSLVATERCIQTQSQCSIIFQWQTFQIPLERANITTTCDTNLESRCETYGYNTSFDGQAAPLPCDEKIVDSQGVGLHVSFYSLLLMQIFK
eukprot:symbB.v1.2.027824.t3/scaffold2886.1/size67984/5